jgi:hypothetical protein
MIDQAGLIPCDHRGDLVLGNRRNRYWCRHPKVTDHKPEAVLVSEMVCTECIWANWRPEEMKSLYFQRRESGLTAEQYTARINTCNECEFREGDYCTKAKGCRLSFKAMRSGFVCPAGLHELIGLDS